MTAITSARPKPGNAEAMYDSGMPEHQRPRDMAAKREQLEIAARDGQTKAMIEMAVLLQNADPPEIDTALTWWRRAADAGDSEAMTYLGAVQFRQVPPDAAGAMHWWMLAAQSGNAEAMGLVGGMLAEADPPDPEGSRHWNQQAAERGDTNAMINFGLQLRYSDTPDQDGCRRWIQLSAEKGNTDGMVILGQLLADSDVADLAGARRWWQRAAERGDANAVVILGAVIAVEGDWEKASALLRQATGAGVEHASDYLNAIDQDSAVRERACTTLRSLADDDYAMAFLGVAALRSGDRGQACAVWTATAQANDNSLASALLKI
jgi:TPR repeat protein